MTTIAYCNPFVPPEWITAHGMRPHWLTLAPHQNCGSSAPPRGLCPFAGDVMREATTGLKATAIVLTTACDQMRYAAAQLQRESKTRVFLMHVPTVWQTEAATQLYIKELERLGCYLVECGGTAPTRERLVDCMFAYDQSRSAVRSVRDRLSALEFFRAVSCLRGNAPSDLQLSVEPQQPDGVPLALLGGPLTERHLPVLQHIEQAGGRVVLDATEGGERTLPDTFDRPAVRLAPKTELARAYFKTIPDVFRRPNDVLYQWLGDKILSRKVRGILFRRFVWCDLWHAELSRLKEWSPVPVLDLDVTDDDVAMNRTAGRIEAFLEMLGN